MPRRTGITIPTIAPANAIAAPRNEWMAIPARNRMPTTTLSANMTSLIPLAAAIYPISTGIMEIFAASTGIPAVGKSGPREKLSKAYTAAMNIQQVRMNGAVEAGMSQGCRILINAASTIVDNIEASTTYNQS